MRAIQRADYLLKAWKTRWIQARVRLSNLEHYQEYARFYLDEYPLQVGLRLDYFLRGITELKTHSKALSYEEIKKVLGETENTNETCWITQRFMRKN